MRKQRWSLRRARVLVGAKFLLIAGLVGFVLLAWLISLIAGLDRAVHLGPVIAAAMAGVPALFWLGFFYLLDRHEPEPKNLIAGVFVLGALIAAPLAGFVVKHVAPEPALAIDYSLRSWVDHVLYAVMAVGLAQEMCKYAAVRYTVYLSREFDEPMDGIVYMMACGTGFAVWENYHWLADQGRSIGGHVVLLPVAAARVVVTTLAHASFAGALGYVMGRAKFSRRGAVLRAVLVLLGLLGAAALNGSFQLVYSAVLGAGMTEHVWRGLLWAMLYAAAVFGVIWFLAQRLLAASPFRPGAV